MVSVAQSVELRIVIPAVVGSSPIVHPMLKDQNADVVKLVYTLVLGTSAERRESSSLSIRTIYRPDKWCFFLCCERGPVSRAPDCDSGGRGF